MTLNALKCNHLTPLGLKGLTTVPSKFNGRQMYIVMLVWPWCRQTTLTFIQWPWP